MKKPLRKLKFFFASIFLLLAFSVSGWGQIIAEWNFENSEKRAEIGSTHYTADEGVAANKDISIISINGSVITGFVGGTGGSGTFAITSNNWHDGSGTKYWMIQISTEGFHGLNLKSKQQSSNTGPRDFEVQYSINGTDWTTIETITVANNFTTGVLDVNLPAGCNNQPSLSIRWVVTSTSSVSGGIVASGGTNRIDDIIITADITPPSPTFDPADGSADVVTTVNPVITFDEIIFTTAGIAVDNSNVEGLITFRKTDAAGDNVAFTATIADGKVITIMPDAELENEQLYYLAVAPVEDAAGNESNTQSITFTTAGETTPILLLTGTYPGPYYAGDDVTVTWDAANLNFVIVEAWVPHIAGWEDMTGSVDAAAGTATFPIPAEAPYIDQYKIRVRNAEGDTPVDESDPFKVRAVATTLAAVRAYAVNDEFRYDGTAIVSATDGFNNRKFIQDATAAILIYDEGPVITSTYNIGDGMTGIIGRKTIGNNMLRLVPLADPGPPATVGNPIEPQVFTIAGVTTNDQAKLIKFEKVRFTSTGNFANARNYTITDGSDNYVVRSDFWNVDYIGQAIPTKFLDITGVVLQHNTVLQIVPRNLADFKTYNDDATLSVFTIGGEDMLALDGIVVDEPEDKGAYYEVADFSSFTGLVATLNDDNAQKVVMVNGVTVDEGDLATLSFADGDVILVGVVAEDTKTTKLYKVTLWDEIPFINITKPEDGAAYFVLQTLSIEWETNLTGMFDVEVTFPNDMTEIVEEVNAEDGVLNLQIPNGIPSGTYKFRLIWKENTSVTSNQLTVTATDNLKPSLVVTRPANGAKNVLVDQVLRMTFDEDVFANTGNIVVKKAEDNSVFATIDIEGTNVAFNRNEVEITLPEMDTDTEYYVLADQGIVMDINGLEFDGITDENAWRFTTVGFYEITVLVTDGTTPVEDANVFLSTDPVRNLQTNAEGKAIFEDVPFGNFGLSVSKVNYQTINIAIEADQDKTIPVILIPDGATTYEVRFELTHDGNPFPWARVDLEGYGNRWADENGIAVFSQVLPADDIPFTVTNWDIKTYEGLVTVTDANVVVSVAVTKVYEVVFIVTDGIAPVGGALVEFDGQEVTTTESGYAIFEKAREGMAKPYTISKTGYVSYVGAADVGDHWNQISVVLEKVKVTVTFNVTDETGAVEGALVDFNEEQKTTGSDGKAIFTEVEYEMGIPYIISKDGYHTANGTVDAIDDTDVNVTLDLIKYTVTFTVNHGANPVSGATVTVSGQSPVTTNASGVATIDLAPGAYTYSVAATGFVGVTDIGFNVINEALSIPVNLSAVNIIDPGSQQNKMLVYPNPSDGRFTLEIGKLSSQKVMVEILDITGKVVYRNDFSVLGNLKETIDLQNVTKGMYFLRVMEGDKISTMKLMFR